MSATQVKYGVDGLPSVTFQHNPAIDYQIVDSRLLYRRIVASGVASSDEKRWWFLGDFRKAFAYMENWPITMTQAPIGSDAAAVINPRFVAKITM